MNKTFTSIVAAGLGAMAFRMTSSKNNRMFSERNMKKMRKRLMKTFS